jgi:hypothetical protein
MNTDLYTNYSYCAPDLHINPWPQLFPEYGYVTQNTLRMDILFAVSTLNKSRLGVISCMY